MPSSQCVEMEAQLSHYSCFFGEVSMKRVFSPNETVYRYEILTKRIKFNSAVGNNVKTRRSQRTGT